MDIETIFDDAIDRIFTVQGRAATFTPATGSAISCNVILSTDWEPGPDGYSSKAGNTVQVIEAVLDDLGRAPVRGETFTVSGTTYTVQYTKDQDERCVSVAVK